tara:strand:- start:2849 stop:3259 length:411 start_codon:yes stop_codon:yes gene_type:complete
MIDVVFLLVVFFVAVSQLVDRERLELDLPQPTPSAAHQPEEGGRAVVNVLPGPEGTSLGYQVDGRMFAVDSAGQSELIDHLRQRLQSTPGLFINVRADKQTGWGWVAPVMSAARHAATLAGDSAARVRLSVDSGGR